MANARAFPGATGLGFDEVTAWRSPCRWLRCILRQGKGADLVYASKEFTTPHRELDDYALRLRNAVAVLRQRSVAGMDRIHHALP